MPGAYAHYKVGQSVLAQLTKGIRDTAEQESELYNLGLHGPDLLFYYKPYLRTRTSAAGFRAHKKAAGNFSQPPRPQPPPLKTPPPRGLIFTARSAISRWTAYAIRT